MTANGKQWKERNTMNHRCCTRKTDLRKENSRRIDCAFTGRAGGGSIVESIEKKKETKNPPLLYNLAELQNDCSKYFKISPDETLRIVQELYEKKMTTYPRTDARVLSTAVAKEIYKNLNGLKGYAPAVNFVGEILQSGSYKNIAKTRYVNDKQITDHYAIIPTGQGLNNLNGLNPTAAKVYEIIVRRFLSIFYPAAVYQKLALTVGIKEEKFFANFKVLVEEGYLKVTEFSFAKKKDDERRKRAVRIIKMLRMARKTERMKLRKRILQIRRIRNLLLWYSV